LCFSDCKTQDLNHCTMHRPPQELERIDQKVKGLEGGLIHNHGFFLLYPTKVQELVRAKPLYVQ
jgi:hypothetical protein